MSGVAEAPKMDELRVGMTQDGSVFSYGDSSFDSTNISHFCSNWSLESRDNPFLPGGDLSKEAEELLKKATIVRDKFFLEQEQEKLLQNAEPQGSPYPDPIPESSNDVADGKLHNATNNAEVLEERITPSAVRHVEAAPPPPPPPRENGKAREASALEASPDKVRLEMGCSPAADGVANDTDAEQQDKDKSKRRPKCCLLM